MDGRIDSSTTSIEQALVALAYELLDAHDDTARLVRCGAEDDWPAHLDVLAAVNEPG
jgi:hypothetical protein